MILSWKWWSVQLIKVNRHYLTSALEKRQLMKWVLFCDPRGNVLKNNFILLEYSIYFSKIHIWYFDNQWGSSRNNLTQFAWSPPCDRKRFRWPKLKQTRQAGRCCCVCLYLCHLVAKKESCGWGDLLKRDWVQKISFRPSAKYWVPDFIRSMKCLIFLQVWRCHFMDHFRLLGWIDREHFMPNGRPISLFAYFAITLGGISIQILQGRWLLVYPLLIRKNSRKCRRFWCPVGQRYFKSHTQRDIIPGNGNELVLCQLLRLIANFSFTLWKKYCEHLLFVVSAGNKDISIITGNS